MEKVFIFQVQAMQSFNVISGLECSSFMYKEQVSINIINMVIRIDHFLPHVARSRRSVIFLLVMMAQTDNTALVLDLGSGI